MRAVNAGVVVAAATLAGALGAGAAQAAPSAESHAAQAVAGVHTYTVQRGDTLSAIGVRTHESWTALATANHIRAPYTIYPGEVLRLPEAVTPPSKPRPPAKSTKPVDVDSYVVRAGDSLWLIGHRFDVSWESIASVNHLKAPYTIYPREVLRLP
jgi:nucleoid-associated protein YgaU